jgi:hypothetical protein
LFAEQINSGEKVLPPKAQQRCVKLTPMPSISLNLISFRDSLEETVAEGTEHDGALG